MAMYGTQGTQWEKFPGVTWESGAGLILHHGGDHKYQKEAGWYLDKDRDWKTKWDFGQGKSQYAQDWGMTGGYIGYHEDRDRYARKDPSKLDRAAYTTGRWMKGSAPGQGPKHKGYASPLKGMALERLDWDAYDRDIQYKNWLKETGKEKFNTLQDILDAEGWLSGEAISGKRHREELAELKAQLEQEKLLRERQLQGTTPKHLDTSQSPTPIGGVGTVQPVPGIGGSQPPITIQPYPLPGGGGGGVSAGGGSPLQGVSGHDFLNSPQYAQERAKWEQQLKDRDAVHQQSIANLQSQWGTQQQGYQQQLTDRDAAHAQAIANLQSQWGAQEKTYAQQLADLGFRSQNELADLRSSLTNQFSQDRAAQDRAYQTRLSDLTSGWDTQRADYSRQLGGLQGQIGGLQGQLSGYEGQIGGLQSQISGYQEREQAFKEAALQDAQRSRVAASYGPGSGAGAKGVATGKWLQPQRQRLASGGARGTFGRQGMRISGLNI